MVTQVRSVLESQVRVNQVSSNKEVATPVSLGEEHLLQVRELLQYLDSLDRPIVFFDLESTGLEGNATRIVEISLVKLHPDSRVETFGSRINPQVEIPKELTAIHGISNDDVKGCPTFGEVAKELQDFTRDSHLGGYNVLNLDFNLLSSEFKRQGIPFSIEGRAIIDPMRIFHRNVPIEKGGKRRLIDAYKLYCGKDLTNAHSALADITATIEVLVEQFKRYTNLPRNIYKLSSYCQAKLPEYVDFQGKLLWQKNDEGKWEIICGYLGPKSKLYRGKPLKEVIESDPEYLKWILEPKEYDFSDEVKEIIRNAISGVFPEPPKA